ncbi:Site-specific DNA recombinase [Thermoflavimicrobium dichotomicum]|uniref:Site-specific DNA recombinase n=1 Tax=Thermoflavimicrobium dichotomicum TaxID=46223 RepID=A0A1I3MRJ6_9BACL|nr:recombinase family protein [Thermoflavimicrobium dichotomicum]SFI99579.1 Site-specific DNA recombinase [Thermoflavimicrobium dichotomicum]
MKRVAMYLRKSRADLEAEARGEAETLAKHKKTLLEVAKQQNLNIVKIYQEIISGESIIHRPEMIKLLEEVEQGLYDAVLVMDMDRLGRGNMQDQGYILDTFKRSKTKIITPRKVYDLENEFDEEYSEFEAFMARKEFKIIKRRLQSGRLRSVKDGNYVGARPPYGYQKTKKEDGSITLVPDPEQAPVVKMIFEWYTSEDPNERMGTTNIAKKLNELGIPSYYGGDWSNNVVLQILRNPVYIGKIAWGKVKRIKSSDPNKGVDARMRPEGEQTIVDGKHESIISEEIFQKAQEIRQKKRHPRWKPNTTLQNPLAGLVICGICDATMVLKRSNRKNKLPHLICDNKGKGGNCNKSSRLEHIEKRILESLEDWLKQYKLRFDPNDLVSQSSKIEVYQMTIKSIQEEIRSLQKQKQRLHDLLERGIYDEETFLDRSQNIAKRLANARESLEKAIHDLNYEQEKMNARMRIIPQVEHVLEVYHQLDTAEQKNILLKTVIDKCIYIKEKHQKNDEFTLTIHTKV